MKIFLGRQSLIGDIVTYLPVLTLVEKLYPNSYKLFSLAKKCSQILPLLANYPLIDKVQISELMEGLGETDIFIKNSCDLFIEVNPQHKQYDWYNNRHMIEENFDMINFDPNELTYAERIPKLIKWFDTSQENAIAVWPCAGYGREGWRHPLKDWYDNFLVDLYKKFGLKVYQFGSLNDYNLAIGHEFISDARQLSFFEQVKLTLSCRMMLGTDSGSSLVMAAYGFPQVSLITNHNRNHHSNFLALAPRNPNNINIFTHNGFGKLANENVLDAISSIIV